MSNSPEPSHSIRSTPTSTSTIRSPTISPPSPSPASASSPLAESSSPSPSPTPTTSSSTPTPTQTPTPTPTPTPSPSPSITLAHPSTFHQITYTSLTTPERHLITTHARNLRLRTGIRPTPASLATWFAQHHSGRLPSTPTIIRLTQIKRRKRINAELKSLAWGFIVDRVLRTGRRPELGEIVGFVAAREGRRRRGVVVKRAMDGWERRVLARMEVLSDSDGEGEDVLVHGVGEVVVPMEEEMRVLLAERIRVREERVLDAVARGLEVWCRGAAGMEVGVTEGALNMKARVLLAEADKDMEFPPGWITQWRLKHGLRKTDGGSMSPPVVPRPAASALIPTVSTVTAAALEAGSGPATDAAAQKRVPATPLGLSFGQTPDANNDVDESYRVYLDLIPEQYRNEKKPPIPGDRDLPIYLDD